jgi:hypothetical protein
MAFREAEQRFLLLFLEKEEEYWLWFCEATPNSSVSFFSRKEPKALALRGYFILCGV